MCPACTCWVASSALRVVAGSYVKIIWLTFFLLPQDFCVLHMKLGCERTPGEVNQSTFFRVYGNQPENIPQIKRFSTSEFCQLGSAAFWCKYSHVILAQAK